MDDILGLVVLAIVMGLVSNDSLDVVSIGFTTVKAVGVLAALMLIGVFVLSTSYQLAMPQERLSYARSMKMAWPNGCRWYRANTARYPVMAPRKPQS